MDQASRKSFDLEDPADLLEKLRYDIMRLKSAGSSIDLRYAAFDCAIAAWHLVDWLLASVPEAQQVRLSGTPHGVAGGNKGFVKRNESRLPGIRECQLIANAGKHRILTKHDDASVSATTGILWDRALEEEDFKTGSFPKSSPVAYIKKGDQKMNAVDFFSHLERAWRHLLVEEGCLSPHVLGREIDHTLWYTYSFDDYYWRDDEEA